MREMPKILNTIGNVTLALITISALTVFVTGLSVISTGREINVLEKYLENAEGAQPDFENNMLMYTTKTSKIIGQLMELRPESEEDYVAFISRVEQVGKQLALDLEIKSSKEEDKAVKGKKDEVKAETMSYLLSFYGTQQDVLRLASELQDLPYFIRIEDLTFNNLDHLDADEKKVPNASMVIKLYVKK
jgi:hypothetical protein